MNEFLPSRFDEHRDRLALGIEPVDAARRTRLPHALDVSFDSTPIPAGIEIQRHNSLVYVLLYDKRLKSPVRLRFADPRRRIVPRRISYAIPADIETATPRIRRPRFFPGAAYDVSQTATGMRGRAVWSASEAAARPVPWVRVVARVNGDIVGLARGDDRGEFLLVLMPEAAGHAAEFTAAMEIKVQVTVFGPPTAPPPPVTPFGGDRTADALRDLPIEQLGLVNADDLSPDQRPWGASERSTAREVTFTLGTLHAEQPPFAFNP